MPLTAVRWKDREEHEAPVEDFLKAAQADPTFPIPYPIAAAMLSDEDRPSDGFSVTQLLSGCLRCKVLQHFEDFTEDVMDRWFRWRGTMFHKSMEGHPPPDTITEVRFYADMPHGLGVLSGKPDVIYPEQGVLVDAKTTKRIPLYGPWPNHVEQLNLYRWLINHSHTWDAELTVDPLRIDFQRLVIWYVDEAGVKPMTVMSSRQVATKAGAKNPTKTVREPAVWTNEECEAFLVSRYEDMKVAFETYENTRRLPDFPPQFDFIGGWEHQYSPTAHLCVERYIDERTS